MSDPIGSLGRKWRWLRAISLCAIVLCLVGTIASFWGPRVGIHTSTADPRPGRLYTTAGLGYGMFDFNNRLAFGDMVEGSTFFTVFPLKEYQASIWLWPKYGFGTIKHAPLGDSTWMLAVYLPLWMPALFFAALGITSHRLATRPRRRFRAGLCPKCAYPLNGKGCTECGWARPSTVGVQAMAVPEGVPK